MLSTPTKILFCDLTLAPGERAVAEYQETIPPSASPSYRGTSVKYSYKVTSQFLLQMLQKSIPGDLGQSNPWCHIVPLESAYKGSQHLWLQSGCLCKCNPCSRRRTWTYQPFPGGHTGDRKCSRPDHAGRPGHHQQAQRQLLQHCQHAGEGLQVLLVQEVIPPRGRHRWHF